MPLLDTKGIDRMRVSQENEVLDQKIEATQTVISHLIVLTHAKHLKSKVLTSPYSLPTILCPSIPRYAILAYKPNFNRDRAVVGYLRLRNVAYS